jgi:hypothetical protein
MKRLPLILVCAACLAAGVVGGHAVKMALRQDETGTAAGHRERKPATPAPDKALAAAGGVLERAALLFSLAEHASPGDLASLITACQDDFAALQMLADIWLQKDPAAFVRALARSPAMKGASHERLFIYWRISPHAGA